MTSLGYRMGPSIRPPGVVPEGRGHSARETPVISLRGTNQRAGPGVREHLQIVPGDVQTTEGLEGMKENGGELRQLVVGQVQLLQLPQADPVSSG